MASVFNAPRPSRGFPNSTTAKFVPRTVNSSSAIQVTGRSPALRDGVTAVGLWPCRRTVPVARTGGGSHPFGTVSPSGTDGRAARGMFPLWDDVIAPVIDAVGARRIIEIGALRGETTTRVL